MSVPLYQVDAFTERPFAGNPAAVCLLPGPRDERWMQQVAQEMNLSETAFLHRAGDGWRLRWFTPAVEVDLCGHATLAGAHVLWETGALRPDETEYDFVSRFFAPGSGVPEDPVTGSAHCCLGPYWAERLGRDELRGYQASARGGVVGVKVLGERVLLRGKAVTVLRGELLA